MLVQRGLYRTAAALHRDPPRGLGRRSTRQIRSTRAATTGCVRSGLRREGPQGHTARSGCGKNSQVPTGRPQWRLQGMGEQLGQQDPREQPRQLPHLQAGGDSFKNGFRFLCQLMSSARAYGACLNYPFLVQDGGSVRALQKSASVLLAISYVNAATAHSKASSTAHSSSNSIRV